MSMPAATLASQPSLRPAQSADVRVAASTRTGPPRRAWQAAMALPYCGGPPCWPQPSLGGGSILLPWGWPNGGQGAWGSGRQRPAAGAHAGKTCIPRPPQPCGRWPKRTDHQPPPCVPPWPLHACQRQRLAPPCAPPGRGRPRGPRPRRGPRGSSAWEGGGAPWGKPKRTRSFRRPRLCAISLQTRPASGGSAGGPTGAHRLESDRASWRWRPRGAPAGRGRGLRSRSGAASTSHLLGAWGGRGGPPPHPLGAALPR